MIIVKSIIAYGAPTKQGQPFRARRAAWASRRSAAPSASTAGRRTRASWSATRSVSTSPT